ncbi:ATP-dependent RNA helicase DDX51 [Hylaeus anthracinus]|uniref:ATP-dependent RNA helicase DDX51 n=1 Tax=Hylaeus anthracinus TaxID=313031 RepID=UPI0023B9E1D7|nr:ATP-dependent RNA helicase DDX51 [Hylaeus anthracinus]
MSLFVINRYEGEKEVEVKDEKKHLSELLKKIEERKREKAAENLSKDVEEPEQKKRKRKKEKIDESLEQDINKTTVEDNIELQVDQQRSHKKKKRRKKDIEFDESKSFQNETVDNHENDVSNRLIDSKNVQISKQTKDFVVLGSKTKRKKREVKRVLPEWLMSPEIISIDLNSGPSLEEFHSILGLKMIKVMKTNGIDKLFPVQASMIPWLLKCDKDRQQGWWVRDTCVSAPTGSGKTLAYVLPIVQILQSRLVPKIRCLVVVPAQELAAQVYKVMTMYTSHTSLKVGLLSGASSIEQEQNNILKKTIRETYISMVDIIVATPGRLVDHILKTPGFSLDDLRFLVIDEADRAADWLEHLPKQHRYPPQLTLFNMRHSKIPVQKLLFSATLSQDPEKLNHLGLFKPILFTSVPISDKDGDVNLDKEVGDFIGRYTSPEELTELAVECTMEYKPVAAYQMLVRNNMPFKTLIFTNSGESAHRLTLLLGSFLSDQNVTVGELSAQLMPKQREGMLGRFAAGEIQILVSSDALARGVDILDIQLVISYDLPKHIKGYIHRAGRTGRAGKPGTAISILTPKQVGIFKHMLTNAHKAVPSIEKLDLESVASTIDYSSHVEKLKQDLEKEKQDNLQRKKSVKRIQSVMNFD